MTIAVAESTQAAEARRQAVRCAAEIGFDETDTGKIAIIVTELATNLFKHGGGGEFHIIPRPPAGLELVAIDRGRGIRDVPAALRDGYSTAGSPGTGLGAVARLSHYFDVYTAPAAGTAALALFWLGKRAPAPGALAVGGLSVPQAGETVCGDAWAVVHCGPVTQVLVCDGLGHGPGAAAASSAAVEAFLAEACRGPSAILEAVHAGMRGTRGGAAAAVELNPEEASARYSGIGNISAAVFTPGGVRRFVSHNGTLGHHIYRFQEFRYQFPPDGLLIMHSDGLTTHWSLDHYPGLSAHHPTLIAAVLCRDHARGRDDVTVVAARRFPANPLEPGLSRDKRGRLP